MAAGCLKCSTSITTRGSPSESFATPGAVLESASCTSGDNFDRDKAPAVVLMIASQGYPASFAQVTTSDIEWFQTMDRNRDGDVSRREFTGSIEIFSKLDQNRDALISPEEAKQVGKQ